MKREEIIEICRSNGLQPNKKLGQNFLINEDIRNKIVAAINPAGSDSVLEVGPGLGSLTSKIRGLAGRVTAVEIDSGLARYLKGIFSGDESVEIIHGDFLKTDIEDRFTKIVSNLPYCDAAPILFRFAASFSAENVWVMLQREMVSRITAPPGGRDYGALSVTLSLYFTSKLLFNAGGASFFPRPDVTSSFIHLKRKGDAGLGPAGRERFHLLVKSAFWGRRKTIQRSLTDSPHINLTSDAVRSILNGASIDPAARADILAPEDYIRMAVAADGIMM